MARALTREEAAHLREGRRLKIATLSTLMDNLWFVNPGTGRGQCQMALLNTLDPSQRPYFRPSEAEASDIRAA